MPLEAAVKDGRPPVDTETLSRANAVLLGKPQGAKQSSHAPVAVIK
jgi:hypothetical protein